MELVKKLAEIQQKLKAPKNQRNSFGNYNYRNCEDILEALKPLLGDCAVTLYDEIVMIGERYYVKSIAQISDGESSFQATAYAREPEEKKGMDTAQITGATSSYARKYALNALFAIDDTKDADSHETPPQAPQKPTTKAKDLLKIKIKKFAETKDYDVSNADIVKSIIEDKSGMKIKEMEDITEEVAQMIIGYWKD